MNQGEVADRLQNRFFCKVQRKLKSNLQHRFQCVFEGIGKVGNPTLLDQIYTELHITKGGEGVNEEHEVRQIETTSRKLSEPETVIKCEDIFKSSGQQKNKTVLTKGVAGIGKTVLTQKFILDWAEGRANKEIQLLFPFTFRELNVLRDRQFSLVGLLQHFYSESAGLSSFEDLRVVFIFDGLDECRLPLDFTQTKVLTDVKESTSLNLLLVNLFRGTLLPLAHIWVTTQPAAANQIPAKYVTIVTEIRGFTDAQRVEYFSKRFKHEERYGTAIISHIKTCRTLYIMCHIPVFCWIISTVLHHVMETRDQLPQTLTQMYIHFLLVQIKVKSLKYGGSEVDPQWRTEAREMVQSLGKLAFEQLQKGNLIFYESDLRESGLDVIAASVYSGVFTQVFREEPGLFQDKVYCFIHLSVQEFLAALHVHQTFTNSGVNLLLSTNQSPPDSDPKADFYQSAVDQALKSPTGHLDLFLRFLLGLSLTTNQKLLQSLLPQTGSSSETNLEAVKYIKTKVSQNQSMERCINLFHCLNELKATSQLQQIQENLNAGLLNADTMSHCQWSALAFLLLSSDTELQVFKLKEYCASDKALQKLLPVVKASNKAILSSCDLSEGSCCPLSSVLASQSSILRHLDLSNNPLQDLGVELLCYGLKNPMCRLETLRLSGCLVSETGALCLASALRSTQSHLRDLDLSYNHPGETSVKQLTDLQQDPNNVLETLRLEPTGVQWLTPGLKKYCCELILDPNSTRQHLRLHKGPERVTCVEVQSDWDDEDEPWTQVLCCNALTGICYWEVHWTGQRVDIAVSYRRADDSAFGDNSHSWSLRVTNGRYSVSHNGKTSGVCRFSPSSIISGRIGVFVDCPAGYLSFYDVTSDKMNHLHTFSCTFTEPLFAGFGLTYSESCVSFV